jgi:hypothetical protein
MKIRPVRGSIGVPLAAKTNQVEISPVIASSLSPQPFTSIQYIKGNTGLHCKKRLAVFPSPGGMSLTKLSLAGNDLIISGQGQFG